MRSYRNFSDTDEVRYLRRTISPDKVPIGIDKLPVLYLTIGEPIILYNNTSFRLSAG